MSSADNHTRTPSSAAAAAPGHEQPGSATSSPGPSGAGVPAPPAARLSSSQLKRKKKRESKARQEAEIRASMPDVSLLREMLAANPALLADIEKQQRSDQSARVAHADAAAAVHGAAGMGDAAVPPAPSSLDSSGVSSPALMGASSAFRAYSSSALEQLLRDDSASLSVLLAGSGDHVMAAAADSQSTLQALQALGPAAHPRSFTEGLHALLARLRRQGISVGSSGGESGMDEEVEEERALASDGQSSTGKHSRSTSIDIDGEDAQSLSQRSEIELFRAMLEHIGTPLASASALAHGHSTAADAVPSDIFAALAGRRSSSTLPPSSSAGASSLVRSTRSASAAAALTTLEGDDGTPLLLPDAHLAQLIDASLSGLQAWEDNQLGSGAATPASATVDFNLNSTSIESFAHVLCKCSPSPSSASAVSSDAAGASGASGTFTTKSKDGNSSGDVLHMTLCTNCGMFKVKDGDGVATAADSTRRSSSAAPPPPASVAPINSSTSSTGSAVTSPSKKKGRKHGQTEKNPVTPVQPAKEAPAAPASAATHVNTASPAMASPAANKSRSAAAASPLATSAAAVFAPSTAASSSSSGAASSPASCVNHGSGSCSCCSTLATLLPKLQDLSSLQQRLSSLENSAKQEKKAQAERLRGIDKLEAQLKTQQAGFQRLLAEERGARIAAEESLRRSVDGRVDARLELLHTSVNDFMASASQQNATSASEQKQRATKQAERLAALEKSLGAAGLIAKEEAAAEAKKHAQRLEKTLEAKAKELKQLVQPAVGTAAAAASATAAAAAANKEVAQLKQRLEQALASMDQWKLQHQQRESQVFAAAASMEATMQSLGLQHPMPPPSVGPVSYSGVVPRQSAPPAAAATSLHSVFGSSTSSALKQPLAWQQPQSLQSQTQQQQQLSTDALYAFDSDSLGSSSVIDDSQSQLAPSFFSSWPPSQQSALGGHSIGGGLGGGIGSSVGVGVGALRDGPSLAFASNGTSSPVAPFRSATQSRTLTMLGLHEQ